MLSRTSRVVAASSSRAVGMWATRAAVVSACRMPVAISGRRFLSTEAQGVNKSLAEVDPEVTAIIEQEKERQRKSIVLIASENFAPKYVLEATGSLMTNKYSEGYPGARYYGGNEFIDMAESLCQKRALEAFRLDPAKWGVNVQSLSGSPANFQVYTALMEPHERLMALDLPHGGHLSHGYQTDNKKVSMVSKFFECLPYRLDESTGTVNMSEVDMLAKRFRPKVLVAGTSAYSRLLDYAKFRAAADAVGPQCTLMADMAHISGLVAAGVVPSPFDFCDVVTTTTHKTLRGPRGAMIFYRKGVKATDKKGQEIKYDLEDRINATVFPGMQGGPHNHTITSLAVALKQCTTPEYKAYQEQVLKNSKAMANKLQSHGLKLVSEGTDNHLMLVDVRPNGVTGAKVEKVCELVSITINKNTVPGDASAMNPGGIRIGSPAMTSRGLEEADFEQVAEFIAETIKLAAKVQETTGKKMVDFSAYLAKSEPAEIKDLRSRVEAFSIKFDLVGQ